MSLDTSKLEHVRTRGGKTTARCPACAEAGHDQTRNHLFIRADGRFGCVVYSGDSPDAKAHRKRVFALCGCREIRLLSIRQSVLGRLGRVDESHSEGTPLRTGLLGHLGRLFQTHSASKRDNNKKAVHELDDCERGVPNVLKSLEAVKAQTDQLSKRERSLMLRFCGNESDPIIITAVNLFNATIVE